MSRPQKILLLLGFGAILLSVPFWGEQEFIISKENILRIGVPVFIIMVIKSIIAAIKEKEGE